MSNVEVDGSADSTNTEVVARSRPLQVANLGSEPRRSKFNTTRRQLFSVPRSRSGSVVKVTSAHVGPKHANDDCFMHIAASSHSSTTAPTGPAGKIFCCVFIKRTCRVRRRDRKMSPSGRQHQGLIIFGRQALAARNGSKHQRCSHTLPGNRGIAGPSRVRSRFASFVTLGRSTEILKSPIGSGVTQPARPQTPGFADRRAASGLGQPQHPISGWSAAYAGQQESLDAPDAEGQDLPVQRRRKRDQLPSISAPRSVARVRGALVFTAGDAQAARDP